ncbi:hypothetical protein CYMTET_26658, partial [Cymbomonas tetramitiformis]
MWLLPAWLFQAGTRQGMRRAWRGSAVLGAPFPQGSHEGLAGTLSRVYERAWVSWNPMGRVMIVHPATCINPATLQDMVSLTDGAEAKVLKIVITIAPHFALQTLTATPTNAAKQNLGVALIKTRTRRKLHGETMYFAANYQLLRPRQRRPQLHHQQLPPQQ